MVCGWVCVAGKAGQGKGKGVVLVWVGGGKVARGGGGEGVVEWERRAGSMAVTAGERKAKESGSGSGLGEGGQEDAMSGVGSLIMLRRYPVVPPYRSVRARTYPPEKPRLRRCGAKGPWTSEQQA